MFIRIFQAPSLTAIARHTLYLLCILSIPCPGMLDSRPFIPANRAELRNPNICHGHRNGFNDDEGIGRYAALGLGSSSSRK